MGLYDYLTNQLGGLVYIYVSMRLFVNGQQVEIQEGITLFEFLQSSGIQIRPVGLAVAVNEEIVPKSKYAEYKLKEGDRVEIVNIVGGG